jgi:prevent-host-death family protein
MKTIGAAKFKEQCLMLLDELGEDGLIVTKHGKPVAKVIPFASGDRNLIGALKGKIKVKGETRSTGLAWHAQS